MRRTAALALAAVLCLAAHPAAVAAQSGDEQVTAGEPTDGREAVGLRLRRSDVDR